ncbi:MAG: hypothetical protein GPJ54_16760 [Candidatus Heimdallarchaeota archaeon]|nr:hypothetical protein [Candidatus Heimdallarchaeota archaeon]
MKIKVLIFLTLISFVLLMSSLNIQAEQNNFFYTKVTSVNSWKIVVNSASSSSRVTFNISGFVENRSHEIIYVGTPCSNNDFVAYVIFKEASKNYYGSSSQVCNDTMGAFPVEIGISYLNFRTTFIIKETLDHLPDGNYHFSIIGGSSFRNIAHKIYNLTLNVSNSGAKFKTSVDSAVFSHFVISYDLTPILIFIVLIGASHYKIKKSNY